MFDKRVLDPASGSRMFYFDKRDPRVLFGDLRDESHVLCDSRTLTVAPDQVMDFRCLPFDDEMFRLVVFDPPHFKNIGETAYMALKYGVLNSLTWQEDIRQGFAECFRVLEPLGVLIFKWSEVQIPLREILALTPERPLFGHRSGKASLTHWVCFIKATRDVPELL